MKPYWANGVSTLYHADAREIPLPDGSVHCAITSPPYFGLRDYGLGEWQGGDIECEHNPDPRVWINQADRGTDPTPGWRGRNDEAWPQNTCGHCGAVQESAGIGTEATLAEHIDNIVAVFREVRRVLRDDGTAWLNYGDAYAGSGKGRNGDGTFNFSGGKQDTNIGSTMGNLATASDLPPKNLLGLPWRVAFALQDDGWILRSAIVWHKPNPMPESVSDRPTSAYENVFLLAKSNAATYWTHRDQRGARTRPEPDYRWVDAATDTEYSVKPDNVSGEIIECPACDGKGEIVLQDGQVSLFDGVPEMIETCAKCTTECKKCDDPHAGYLHRWKRINLWRSRDYYYDAEAIREANTAWTIERARYPKAGHKRRDGSADDSGIAAHSQRENGTGNLSGANARNVWTIPTQGRSDAHFATFPDELPRRCILAGTSAHGVCEQCGAPWERAVERTAMVIDRSARTHSMGRTRSSGTMVEPATSATTGWRPTCDHDAGTVPATVLDCFVGSGTTVAVAQTLGRRGVGVDLSAEYLDIAVKRMSGISLPMRI